jgi:predicted membrane-bound mannosyltransferase
MTEKAESVRVIRKPARFASVWAVGAILLYPIVADATVETFFHHAPLPLWVAGSVGAYLVPIWYLA